MAAVVVPRPDPLADVSDACLPLLAASCASFLRRGARFSARSALPSFTEARAEDLRHRPGRLPPVASRGQFGQAPLVRLGFFPSAFTGRAVPSESGQLPDHPAATFFRSWHPRRRSARPCGFCASRLGYRQFRSSKTPPAQVIRERIRCRPRTGPADRAVIAAWPGVVIIRSRRRSWVLHALRSVAPIPG